MVGVVARVRAGRGGIDPSLRGYQVLFRANESNYCPGCGRAQWYVGRITAECVFCGTALPLAEAHVGESGSTWSHSGGPVHRRILQPVEPSERRRDLREPGGGRKIHLLIDGAAQSVEVYNLSTGGLMVDSSAALTGAKSVEVIAPDGEIVGATVRWADGDHAGLQFKRSVRLDLSPPTLAG